jgi:hypothetical protein
LYEPLGYEVSGVITYPKYVQVTVAIQRKEGKEFGAQVS